MRITAVFLLTLVLPAVPLPAQEYATVLVSRHILTNEGVITLAKAGFDELFIIERIRTSRTRFDTSVEGLVALKQAGVSEDLIRVIALADRRNYPMPLEAAPAAASGPPQPQVTIEKHWWGFRWRTQ